MTSRAAPHPSGRLGLGSLRLTAVPGVVAALVGLTALFAVLAPGFLSVGNVTNVLVQSVVLLLLALPMTLLIMTEGLDLSMGAVLALASVVLAVVAVRTDSVLLGFAAALCVGFAFGLLNGWLVTMLAIPPFVATLGTLGAAQGFALIASEGQSVVGLPDAIGDLYAGQILGVPVPLLVGALFYGLFHLLLQRSPYGTYVRALGGNREALVLAGVRWRRVLVSLYALSGAMAAVAALLMTARMNAGHPNASIGLEFDAIAAVALGGTSFEKGNGWLLGTLLGVLTVGVLRNGLNVLGIPSSAQVACIGALLIAAFFADGLRSGRAA